MLAGFDLAQHRLLRLRRASEFPFNPLEAHLEVGQGGPGQSTAMRLNVLNFDELL